MKRLSIIGSTGSIGTSALRVVSQRDDIELFGLCAHKNVDLLIEQIKLYKPRVACLTGYTNSPELRKNAGSTELFFGENAYELCLEKNSCDIALIASLGIAGLSSLLFGIKNDIQIALANKESLVCGGAIVNQLLKEKNASILPVDSELSALFQCLKGYDLSGVKRLILTASGGALRTLSKEKMLGATVDEVLRHPNWNMGKKITVDCATMINKGLEVIETSHLFRTDISKIDIVIHPQSIIHSMVEYNNSAVIAHMSPTDMCHAIEYALCYPQVNESVCGYLNFAKVGTLTFEEPDFEKFPCLKLALTCLAHSPWACVVLNAANEVAVDKFLRGEITFGQIYGLIHGALEALTPIDCKNIENVFETDRLTREFMK